MALRNMHSYVEFVSAKSIYPSFFFQQDAEKNLAKVQILSVSLILLPICIKKIYFYGLFYSMHVMCLLVHSKVSGF